MANLKVYCALKQKEVAPPQKQKQTVENLGHSPPNQQFQPMGYISNSLSNPPIVSP